MNCDHLHLADRETNTQSPDAQPASSRQCQDPTFTLECCSWMANKALTPQAQGRKQTTAPALTYPQVPQLSQRHLGVTLSQWERKQAPDLPLLELIWCLNWGLTACCVLHSVKQGLGPSGCHTFPGLQEVIAGPPGV